MERVLAAVAAAVLLAGCAADRRYGNNPPPSYASPPAHLTRPPATAQSAAPKTVRPLGAGPLAVASVEAYMDNQENALRVALRSTGAIIGRQGDALVLNMRSDALFGPNSVELSPRGREIVVRVALVVRKFDSTQLTINGYTDTTGTQRQNVQVSQKRADTVAEALSGQGVDPHRIAAKGYGEAGLKIPTGDKVNEARNRRVEIRITPQVKA